MTETSRRCPICWEPMIPGRGERPASFNGRTFCEKSCASKSRAARYDSILRDGNAPVSSPKAEPKPAGRKALPKQPCAACGKEVANSRRIFCSVECATAHRRRPGPRTAAAAPPRPRIATQPLCQPQQPHGTGLGVIPKKRKPMPTVDPLLCVWPARAIWAPDGRAIALGLHAFGATAEILVRGWATTVPDDADEYVTPCFETAGAAKLWDAICDHKLGRSTVAAAALTKAELAKAEAGR